MMDTQTNGSMYDRQSQAAKTPAKPSRAAVEFQSFLDDVEAFVAEATTLSGEELEQAKTKLYERIDTIKDTFNDISGGIRYKARKGAEITNHYVHEQPWPAIGASALVGVVVGFLLARRH